MPAVSTLATEKYKVDISLHSIIQVNFELKLSNEDVNVIRRKFMLTEEKVLIAVTNQIFQIQKHISEKYYLIICLNMKIIIIKKICIKKTSKSFFLIGLSMTLVKQRHYALLNWCYATPYFLSNVFTSHPIVCLPLTLYPHFTKPEFLLLLVLRDQNSTPNSITTSVVECYKFFELKKHFLTQLTLATWGIFPPNYPNLNHVWMPP